MIPQEKMEAVHRGLREAFGVMAWDNIHDLTERPGSNRVYRISVRGSRYLLRINTRPGDFALSSQCMKAAAEAGLAPHVWYTNVEDRVCITEFVDAVPLGMTDALRRVPAMLRKLHALPSFPRANYNTTCTFLLNQGPALDGFLQSFRAAGILPQDEAAKLFALHEQLAAAYGRCEPDMAPSHNDLFKPDNILFDGSHVWLVDWEASFQNDRYADLAVVANMLAAGDADERTYLQEYFGAPPSEYQLARLFLMRQVAHLFYAMAFLLLGASGKPVDLSEPAPDYREFQRRFWSGELKLNDSESKIAYGRVHREQLLLNAGQPRFQEALRTAAAAHHSC